MTGSIKWMAVVLALMVLAWTSSARATEDKARDLPPRDLTVALQFPGLIIAAGDSVRVDLVVRNNGRSNETIVFAPIQGPEGWSTSIKGFGDRVTGLFILSEGKRTLTFNAAPLGGAAKPGTHRFTLAWKTTDGRLSGTTALDVFVESGRVVEEREMDLTSSYPVLRGPTGTKFEFSLDVTNRSDEDKLFNLAAHGPTGWELIFKPAYEETQISSLRVKAGQTRSVSVVVSPAYDATVGDFPLKVRIASTTARAEVDLQVSLTGTYAIKAGAPNGLLSLTTQVGRPGNMSIYVRNDGTAVQRRVEFVTYKPENWKIQLKPEAIDGLAPGEIKQVEMIITPAETSLVGDYSVGLTAQGVRATSNVELRITVKASAAWGWIGIAVILLVIGGLALVFRKLGRR